MGSSRAARFLFEIGGGEVDDHSSFGPAVAAIEECGADAVDGFFDGGVGESDDGGFGEGFGAFGEIDFDFAGECVDALEDEGVDFGEHENLPMMWSGGRVMVGVGVGNGKRGGGMTN